ncbi:GHKL domain-containing protein [Paenibacillus sp.]|uniref:sensor histidine kinase n=1 Tax=Paenibacillus sp. TaxID=58172 RepID=UPI0028115256|nr:GHKL domain-containing protein [Paenibacillus sp.]
MLDDLLISLEIGIFSTIPQSFAVLFFTMTFWGIRAERPWLRIAQYTAANTISFMVFMLLPEALRPGSMLFTSAALFYLFRDISRRDRVIMAFTAVILYASLEITTAFAAISLGLAQQSDLANDPRVIIPYLLLGNTIIALVAELLRRYRLSPGKAIRLFFDQKQNRLLFSLVLLFAGNVVISSAVFYYTMLRHPFAASYTLVATSLVSVVILIVTIRSIIAVKNLEILNTQETYVDEIDNLFTTIRGQRHDFLNHVQVIQAFVRRKKFDELERYVSELVGEIVEINDLLQIGHPALAALVKSKMVYALDRKIDFRYSFEGMDRIGHGVASVDYVKIAGNLLDNALDEVLNSDPENRWIEIAGWTDEENFYLSVSNPAYSVTEEQKSNMFRSGFTTKKKDVHSGLGLSIVKERVGHYRGQLDVETAADHVLSFRVKLPLRLHTIAP